MQYLSIHREAERLARGSHGLLDNARLDWDAGGIKCISVEEAWAYMTNAQKVEIPEKFPRIRHPTVLCNRISGDETLTTHIARTSVCFG